MNNYLFVANWKMHKSVAEAVSSARSFAGLAIDVAGSTDVGIAPVSLALPSIAGAGERGGLLLYAQDGHQEDAGAFTGEISLEQLVSFVDGVILGHSERRHVFGETNQQVHEKVVSALHKRMRVILCVGETLEERQAGGSQEYVRDQLLTALEDVSAEDVVLLDVAYEPVWAISRGDVSVKPATLEEITEMHTFVRGLLDERFGDTGGSIRILYGGSVKPENAVDILTLEEVQGALVGNASLELESFSAIVQSLPHS